MFVVKVFVYVFYIQSQIKKKWEEEEKIEFFFWKVKVVKRNSYLYPLYILYEIQY